MKVYFAAHNCSKHARVTFTCHFNILINVNYREIIKIFYEIFFASFGFLLKLKQLVYYLSISMR